MSRAQTEAAMRALLALEAAHGALANELHTLDTRVHYLHREEGRVREAIAVLHTQLAAGLEEDAD